MTRLRILLALACVGFALVIAACADSETPQLPGDQADDPQLVTGRQVYQDKCARCHGGSGGGGAGPKLSDGRMVDEYPDPAAQEQVIRDGRGSMPAWDGRITDDEINAVLRYTREVL
jgi:mono/diheme cytochrome c family protein